jgi:hypothetical protein
LCGRRWTDCHAQLAVMDAMIFFAVAGLVSSALLASSLGGPAAPGLEQADSLRARAADMLRAFLDASLGREAVVLSGGSEVVVPASTKVSDCIVAELAALENAADKGAFADMNDALSAVLHALSGPHVTAYACVYDMDAPTAVLALPSPPPDSPNVYGSSCVLGEELGAVHSIVLLLDPSPPLEGLHVA